MTLTVELTTAGAVTQFQELTPRGKVAYHEDIVVTDGGVAKDFSAGTGWTSFLLEMKAKDDEDGAAIMTATVAFANAPGSDGLLDLDVSDAITAAAQAAAILLDNEKDGLEGTYDLTGIDGETPPLKQLVMFGNWRLTKGVSD